MSLPQIFGYGVQMLTPGQTQDMGLPMIVVHCTGEASREQGSCLPLLASQCEEGISPADLLPLSQTPVPAPSPS